MSDYLHQHGRTLTYQGVPGLGEIHWSQVADTIHPFLFTIPVSQSDTNYLIKDLGRNLNQSLWKFNDYPLEALFQLYPKVNFKMPSNVIVFVLRRNVPGSVCIV